MKGICCKYITPITLLIILLSVTACFKSDDSGFAFTQEVVVEVVHDYPAKPVLAVSFAANQTMVPSYWLDEHEIIREASFLSANDKHQRTILGLAPGTSGFQVKLENKFGQTVSHDARDSLPDFTKPLPLQVNHTPSAEALWPFGEYLLLSVYRELPTGGETLAIALDNHGRTAWVLPLEQPATAIIQTTPTSLIFAHNAGLQQTNTLGQPLEFLSGLKQTLPGNNLSKTLDASYLLPPAIVGKQNNMLMVEPEWRQVTINNHQQRLLGAALISISHDGTVNQRLSLFDILDPLREAQTSLAEPATLTTFANITTQPWADINQLLSPPNSNELIVGVGKQEMIASINPETQQLNWLLGNTHGWQSKWKSRFLKTVENTALPLNPVLLQTYNNGDLLLGSAVDTIVGRYRIDAQQRTIQEITQYTLPVELNALLKTGELEFIILPDEQLLIIDKTTATLYTLGKQGALKQWLAIKPTDELGNWQIAAATQGITLQPPHHKAPELVIDPVLTSNLEQNPLSVMQSWRVDADPTGDPLNIDGEWQVWIEQDATAEAHKLQLEQNHTTASGHFAGEPLQAVVKGNVLSFTLRNQSQGRSVVRRFRATIKPEHNRLQGQVDILINNQLLAQSGWWADRKLNTQ